MAASVSERMGRAGVAAIASERVGRVVRGGAPALAAACGGWARALLDLVYPRACAGCGGVPEAGGHLCWDCRAAMPVIQPPFCSHCGDPVDGRVDRGYVCSWCCSERPAYTRARSALRYRGPVRELLQALKYHRAAHLRADLAGYLAACVSTHFPREVFDAVTAVPLHARRERERSYNQSALLAGALASRLRVPYDWCCLRRDVATPTQTALTAAQRRTNVSRAFSAPDAEWVRGRRLLLVDDVMTTGATVGECARVLRAAGAASVHVVTVARG